MIATRVPDEATDVAGTEVNIDGCLLAGAAASLMMLASVMVAPAPFRTDRRERIGPRRTLRTSRGSGQG